MKLTLKEINKAKQYLSNVGYGTGSNFTVNSVANLMAEWAIKNSKQSKLFPFAFIKWYSGMEDDKITARYSVTTVGVGKTKKEAVNSLCDVLMSLSKEIKEVVHEVNISK